MSIDQQFLACLETGTVFTHINALLPDVIVPDSCRQEHLVFQFNADSGLEVDEFGFSGVVYTPNRGWCSIPWTAVFAVVPASEPEKALVRNISSTVLKPAKRPKGKAAERPYLRRIK